MSKTTYLLTSGIFRSGTTLLTRALDAHREFTVVYQPFMPFFKSWRDAYFEQVVGTPLDPGTPMGVDYRHLFGRERALGEEALSVVIDEARTRDVVAEIERQLQREPEEKPQRLIPFLGRVQPGSAGQVLQALMELVAAASAPEKPAVVGTKEIWCEEFFEPVLALDRFKGLHIIRDPRAVYASRNTGNYAARNMRYPILFIARTWRRSVHYLQSLREHRGYFWLKYEDLVTRPSEVLEEVCGFLGSPFQAAMADPTRYKDGQGNPWRSNSTAATTRAFSLAPLTYWEGALTREEIGVLEFLCAKEMEQLNYARACPDFATDDFWSYEEDAGSVTEWLRKPGHLLTREQKEAEIALLESA